mmetsp:Transcript_31482/g.80255  ORF Transcript_31482/g.80255 Transcript_31482/m.80255 type:complete len:231 (+) Transcript_31482:79-771(+)
MALTGQFASAAAHAATSQVSHNVSQAIGKPLTSGAPSGRMPGHSEINWVDFNYPPLIRLVHFDLNELPSTLTGLVRCLNISFQITVITCLLNLFDTLVIVMSTRAPFRWLVQSALHMLLLPVAALGTFYSGYRGLSEPDSTLVFRFKVAQPALAFAYFLLGVTPWGCTNGLAQLGDMTNYTDGSVFWVVVIIIESFLWLSNCALASANVFRAYKWDIFGVGPSAGPAGRL